MKGIGIPVMRLLIWQVNLTLKQMEFQHSSIRDMGMSWHGAFADFAAEKGI